jgi:hypothetical protein
MRRLWRRCTGTQQRVLQYWGRSNTHQHWFAIGLWFGQKFFNLAFCSYLHLQFFKWAAVPGGRFTNSPKSQSPIVVRNPKLKSNTKINMKTKQIFIPLIAIFIFSLAACKKDTITEPDPTPNATLSADSNYLSKILFIDKNGTFLDTVISAYTYDNLKRVTSVRDYYSNANTDQNLTNYFYNGLDSLPYKRVFIRFDLNGGIQRDTILSYLTYNSNGFLLKDSLLEYRHISLNNQPVFNIRKGISSYSYNTNKIYINSISTTLYDIYGSLYSQAKKDTLTLNANKDVIGIKSKTIYPQNTSELNGIYTYENKPSYCSALNINNIFPINLGDVIYNQTGAKNTRLKSMETTYQNGVLSFIDILDYTNKYTFKANGFPSSALMTYPPSTDYRKLVFIYKTL